MKKKVVISTTLVLLVFLAFMLILKATGDDEMVVLIESDGIFVNDIKVADGNSIVAVDDRYFFIPFMPILEAVASEVSFEEGTGNILFTHARVRYIGQFQEAGNFKFLHVGRIKNRDSRDDDDFIQLHTTGSGGGCRIINDEIYIVYHAGIRLFEALGCTVIFNLESNQS